MALQIWMSNLRLSRVIRGDGEEQRATGRPGSLGAKSEGGHRRVRAACPRWFRARALSYDRTTRFHHHPPRLERTPRVLVGTVGDRNPAIEDDEAQSSPVDTPWTTREGISVSTPADRHSRESSQNP